ncbi:MAG TPA: histidine phosphatase family protein [Kofleriaceae bacterium]|jgi:probable phosphoglycerate mutase|nr:histidine phosphatase family protein [Kofleriaceae bacterium]
MNVLVVRHGETSWNREGRYQGRTDIALSDEGRAQVARLGERLAGVTIARAIASPLERAKSTAEAIIAARVTLQLDPGLLEISHGTWEGQLASDVERSHAEMFGVWRTAPGRDAPAGPGAETLGDVESRAWPVLARLCSQLGPDETGLIVAHDAVNRVLICRVLGLPLERVWTFRQAPASLNVLAGPSLDALQVVRLNDSEHSAPLVGGHVHRAL